MVKCMLSVLWHRYNLAVSSSSCSYLPITEENLKNMKAKEIVKVVLEYIIEAKYVCVDEFGYAYHFNKSYKELDKDTKKLLKNCVKKHI